jgi:hypothetical protein
MFWSVVRMWGCWSNEDVKGSCMQWCASLWTSLFMNYIDVQLHIAVLLIFLVKYSGKCHEKKNNGDCNMTNFTRKYFSPLYDLYAFVFKKRNTNNCVSDIILHNTSFLWYMWQDMHCLTKCEYLEYVVNSINSVCTSDNLQWLMAVMQLLTLC